jgi:hypothetical protein
LGRKYGLYARLNIGFFDVFLKKPKGNCALGSKNKVGIAVTASLKIEKK